MGFLRQLDYARGVSLVYPLEWGQLETCFVEHPSFVERCLQELKRGIMSRCRVTITQ